MFDKYQYKGREERQFHFDTTDTLPYWYSRAISAFADLDRETFLDIAEKWIVETWGITSNPGRWNDEPRQNRFSEGRAETMDHGHGSLPMLERFHTYLEWHAMWCAIGELMKIHPLAKLRPDDYDALENQLARNQLTVPPLWLAKEKERDRRPLPGLVRTDLILSFIFLPPLCKTAEFGS